MKQDRFLLLQRNPSKYLRDDLRSWIKIVGEEVEAIEADLGRLKYSDDERAFWRQYCVKQARKAAPVLADFRKRFPRAKMPPCGEHLELINQGKA